MPLYSSNFLSRSSSLNATLLTETRHYSTPLVNDSETFDIFLSHSFLDRKVVLGVYTELTKMGFSVYVDWIVDRHLSRTNVTKETAELVRKRMNNCKTLLLALSSNAQLSKWVPWELGFVDGHTKKCALLPVAVSTAEEKKFERSEYLLLYPYVKLATLERWASEKMYITESGHYYSEYDGWLRGTQTISYKNQNIDLL